VRYERDLDETTWWPPEFLVELIGKDWFDRVVGVYLYGSESTTRAALVHLAELRAVRELSLGGSSISDQGLSGIKGMRHLVSLDLSNTAVTDAGLFHLTKLKYLRKVTISNTRVTMDGTSALKLARPGLKIVD